MSVLSLITFIQMRFLLLWKEQLYNLIKKEIQATGL